MATTKSIPTAPVLHPPGDALPDLDVFVQNAIAQSKTQDECVSRLESSLAPYVDVPGASSHRFMHGICRALTALAANPHGPY